MIIANIFRDVQAFFVFALSVAAIKYVAEYPYCIRRKRQPTTALLSLWALGTAALMAVILIAVAPWLARNTLAAPILPTS